jgi:hypothetical protein
MAECKTSIINGKIVSEWTGSFGEFKGLCKPAMPPFSGLDQTEALTKWLVAQMWVGILVAVVNFVLSFLQGFMPIVGLIQAILVAFIGAWVSWFMFCKREPSCCCFCIVIVEGWKQMHLVYGILMILQAVLSILNVVSAFMTILSAGNATYLIYGGISLAITILYNITWFFIGLSATKIGAKKAGVELPETVGKAGA